MRIKRKLSILLSICMILTLWSGTALAEETKKGPASFSDLSDHWAEKAILQAADQGIVGGYPDGTFRPEQQIKREEFFTLLSNILTEKPDTSKTTLEFSDVVTGEWYIAVIKTAVAGGMTSGYPDGTFGIGKSMTREEAAQVAASVIPKETSGGGLGVESVKDESQISDWAYDAVDLMFRKGYMKGDPEGNFRPSAPVTRAEATQILLQISENESIICSTAQEQVDYQQMLADLKYGCASKHLATTATGEMDTSDESLAALPKGVFKKGSGTVSDPYLVNTQEQLNHIREHNAADVYFQLDADITITGDFATEKPAATDALADWRLGNWTPLGSAAGTPFTAHLDGNGHTIRGLEINSTGAANPATGEAISKKNLKSAATGFIGYLAEGGSVTDLSIDKSTLVNGGNYTGAVAGYSSGTIKGCTVGDATEVKGESRSGGIAGYTEGLLEDCENAAMVKAANDAAGGIVGEYAVLSGELKNCVNTGTVKGGLRVGGIAGIMNSNSGGVTAVNCTNKGTISASQGLAGGIVGDNANGRGVVTKCVNEGEVSGNNSGGLVGRNTGNVTLCRNEGIVTGDSYIGGIVGFQTDDKTVISECINNGKIQGGSGSSNVGGLAGESSTTIVNCYNTGAVSGGGNVGGAAGKNSGKLMESYNVGTVDGDTAVGGMAGSSSGVITNCYWMQDTAEAGIGLKGGTGTDRLYMVTEESLRGEKTVRTINGQEDVLNALNEGNTENPRWKYGSGSYDYPILVNLEK